MDFHIPAGRAETTLRLLLDQAGDDLEMLYSSDDLRGIETPSVIGRFTRAEALRRLLKNAPLQLRFENGDTFVMILPSGRAAVSSQSSIGTQAKDVTQRTVRIAEVVVTGSLIRGVQDIIAPAIREQDLPAKGTTYATVQEALQSVPLVSRGGPSEVYDPGGNFGRGASVNLRGLGPAATLVLVNGRRQAPSGANADFVDVSNIPWSAVKQIDILPDGASALYGSDAIAGVVNILMRDDLQGAETQMRVSTGVGGGNETLIGQLFGTRWNSGKALLSYQFWHRDALPAQERRYTANSDKTPLGGTNYASERSNPGNLINPFTGQVAYAIPHGQDGSALAVGDLERGSSNLQNRLADADLFPGMKMHSVYVSATQNWRQFKAFADGRFSQRDITQRHSAAEALLLVPNSNPYFVDAFGTPFTLVSYSFAKDFGPITTDGRTQSDAGTLGISADLMNSWTATLTRSYTAENLHWSTRNQVNFGALHDALADSDPQTAFNPFGDGSNTSPQTLASVMATDAESVRSRIVTNSLVADGPIVTLPSGIARLAIGVDRRTETVARGRADPAYRRSVRSAFAELAIPIVGENADARATPHVDLSLAARTERYSDFGSASNPRIGIAAMLSDAFKLRGTWGTSFSAPGLFELYDTSQNHAALVPVRDSQAPEGQSLVLLTQGNNPDLREELARTWTAGVDFVPASVPGLALSLTYYDIRYSDGVFHPAPPLSLEALLNEPQWSALVTRHPSAESVSAICASPGFLGAAGQCAITPPLAVIGTEPRNLSSIWLRGIDIAASRAFETRAGQFSMAFDASYVLALDRALTPTSPVIDVIDTVDNPVAQRARWTIGWNEHGEKGPGFGAHLSLDYAGHYHDRVSTRHSAIETWVGADLTASYRTPAGSGAFDGMEVVFNVNNVLNQDPPFVDREIGYDSQNARPYARVLGLFLRKAW